MKTIIKPIIFMSVTIFIVTVAYAQFAKPEEAIRYRKSLMFLILKHFKPMGAVVQGKVTYEKGTFTENADHVNNLAALPLAASLAPGSDKGDTTLKSVALDNPDKFKKEAESFEAATARLASTSRGGGMDAIKAQFGMVAKSCKSCHQQFRTK